jgi:hypothetical protein
MKYPIRILVVDFTAAWLILTNYYPPISEAFHQLSSASVKMEVNYGE